MVMKKQQEWKGKILEKKRHCRKEEDRKKQEKKTLKEWERMGMVAKEGQGSRGYNRTKGTKTQW